MTYTRIVLLSSLALAVSLFAGCAAPELAEYGAPKHFLAAESDDMDSEPEVMTPTTAKEILNEAKAHPGTQPTFRLGWAREVDGQLGGALEAYRAVVANNSSRLDRQKALARGGALAFEMYLRAGDETQRQQHFQLMKDLLREVRPSQLEHPHKNRLAQADTRYLEIVREGRSHGPLPRFDLVALSAPDRWQVGPPDHGGTVLVFRFYDLGANPCPRALREIQSSSTSGLHIYCVSALPPTAASAQAATAPKNRTAASDALVKKHTEAANETAAAGVATILVTEATQRNLFGIGDLPSTLILDRSNRIHYVIGENVDRECKIIREALRAN